MPCPKQPFCVQRTDARSQLKQIEHWKIGYAAPNSRSRPGIADFRCHWQRCDPDRTGQDKSNSTVIG